MLRIKKGPYGARLGPVPGMVALMVIFDQAMEEAGLDYECTGGREGKHIPGSLHYVDLALDFTVRSRPVDPLVIETVTARIIDRLGDDYDILVKTLPSGAPNFHVEYQPKAPLGKLPP